MILAGLLLASPVRGAADYSAAFLVPPGRYQTNHGSSLAELAGGDLLCTWYAGSHECAPDVQIYLSRFDAKTRRWSEPAVAVARGEKAEGRWFPTKSLGNTALYRDRENVLWLFYAALPFGGWSTARVDYKTSRDEGRTWSVARTLVGGFGRLPRNSPVPVGEGFMVPLYRGIWNKRAFTCLVTAENGVILEKKFADIPGRPAFQAALVQPPGGDLVAYLRNPEWDGLLFSRFDRATGSWSPAEQLALPNPNAAVAAAATPAGETLLVFNNSAERRNPISLALSTDGRNFVTLWDFDRRKDSGFSYPAFLRAADGSYHVTYSYRRETIRHIRFSEEWLAERRRAAGPR